MWTLWWGLGEGMYRVLGILTDVALSISVARLGVSDLGGGFEFLWCGGVGLSGRRSFH